MTTLRYADELGLDVDRIVVHLLAYEAQHIEERVAEVFDALLLLERHPLIGRPAEAGCRELVIGEGRRGYVALYRYDALDDAVEVLALRAQREAGFRDR
ncbi:MAG: type II toxin-antitoxin system RelE/ParE family toxin [Rubrivivax sp.]